MSIIQLFNEDKGTVTTNFVCRNFNVNDKVNVYFKEKFYKATVIDKWFENTFFGKEPYLLMKTDEKVDKERDALLNGHGIKGPTHGKDPIYFIDEPLPYGYEMYEKTIERPATQEEIRENNKSLPF